jgi:beta-glucosidase-like glycosyl hydrolase
LGFDGWVMSDWGATHSTSIKEGLDQVSHRERDSAPLLEMR